MGRFRESSDDDLGGTAIDISPLMDCVFILLIFFIVTTTFVEETGVEVNKPTTAAPSKLEKNSILIALTEAGEVVYGGQKIGVGGVRDLVKRVIQQEQGEPLPVIIQADTDSRSGMLMRIVGEAKLAGAQKVSVATRAE